MRFAPGLSAKRSPEMALAFFVVVVVAFGLAFGFLAWLDCRDFDADEYVEWAHENPEAAWQSYLDSQH